MQQGKFEVKFAETKEELEKAYKLRYEELILEYNDKNTNDDGLDTNEYDNYAKMVIVVDNTTGQLCGCYRLITSDMLPDNGKFSCEVAFDIDKLKQSGEKICELSRAVIKKEYRGGKLLLLL